MDTKFYMRLAAIAACGVLIFSASISLTQNVALAGDKTLSTATVEVELGLMLPTFPTGVPPQSEEIELGRELFSDPLLSRDGSISCASCHSPEHGFADPAPVSVGINGTKGRRNSPTLWNVAYLEQLSWDGRHTSLEQQALAAISNPDEMGLNLDQVRDRVQAKYGARLLKLYRDVSDQSVAKALGSFQRTLVAGNSPVDQYLYAGKHDAINGSAKRGFRIFLGEGRCVQCHTIRCDDCHPFGGATATFTDDRFHNIGVGFEKTDNGDLGRWEITRRQEDLGAFRTPTLRNIELTAPYMHDGSMKTLEEVVDHYNKGGNPNSNLDPDVQRLDLNEQEKRDLIEFLKSLTSDKLRHPPRRP